MANTSSYMHGQTQIFWSSDAMDAEMAESRKWQGRQVPSAQSTANSSPPCLLVRFLASLVLSMHCNPLPILLQLSSSISISGGTVDLRRKLSIRERVTLFRKKYFFQRVYYCLASKRKFNSLFRHNIWLPTLVFQTRNTWQPIRYEIKIEKRL